MRGPTPLSLCTCWRWMHAHILTAHKTVYAAVPATATRTCSAHSAQQLLECLARKLPRLCMGVWHTGLMPVAQQTGLYVGPTLPASRVCNRLASLVASLPVSIAHVMTANNTRCLFVQRTTVWLRGYRSRSVNLLIQNRYRVSKGKTLLARQTNRWSSSRCDAIVCSSLPCCHKNIPQ